MKTTPTTRRTGLGTVETRRRARYQPVRRNTLDQRQPFRAQLGVVTLLCLVALVSIRLPAVPVPPVQPAQAAVSSQSHLVVNKQNPLSPASFEPDDLVPTAGVLLSAPAAASLTAMIGAAETDGISITAVSGYRSYDDQNRLYSGYTGLYGQIHTDALSARPGFSEHQTGLAVDIGNPGGACTLQRCFATTPAGSWAAANAARFGFIVRYPDGATAVTGYDYEPWHLRYVGPEAAADIASHGLTLEAHEGLPAAASY